MPLCLTPLLFLPSVSHVLYLFFFFNHTATTEIYTLSLHDAFRSDRNHSRRTHRHAGERPGPAIGGSRAGAALRPRVRGARRPPGLLVPTGLPSNRGQGGAGKGHRAGQVPVRVLP